MHAQLLQSCPTLCDAMDWSLPSSSVHGILQARIPSGLPSPPPGDLPDPGIEPVSPVSSALQVDSLLLSHWGSPMLPIIPCKIVSKTEKETQMYRRDFWTLWEKARVGCFKRTASKHVCYLGWNRSPAQVGCMRQMLGPGALGRPRGIGQRGRWEGGLGWGIHLKLWLIPVNVWQKPLQYCKVISLQLIKKIKIRKKFTIRTLAFSQASEVFISKAFLWNPLEERFCFQRVHLLRSA